MIRKAGVFFLVVACIMACNNDKQEESETSNGSFMDTLESQTSPKVVPEEFPKDESSDSLLLVWNKKVLNAIKQKDYESLAKYIHPSLGIRFSPYAHIHLTEDIHLSPSEFLTLMEKNKKLTWGSFDGTGDPIELSGAEYFERFVYDADFLNAEKTLTNESASSGNRINNIKTAYLKNDYVENYFSGFDEKYSGMDWRALRLIFKKEGNIYYLIGIVHDEWTI